MGGEVIGILLFLGIVFLFVLAKTAQSLIHISGPNEVLVFSGLKHRIGNRTVGYKLVKGGKGLRIPLLETVDRIDLTNMIIEVNVSGAYSKGGIPLNVQAVANVKVAGDDPLIHNALERLLGKPREEIIKIARETLEGNLRGVLATLTPEQTNEDKQAFAQSLLSEAEHDLSALGLTLDTLKIQSVTDDQGYLAAIGRRQSAELLRRARIAEANARAEAAITEARNHEETVLAQIQARTEIARAEAERRITDARTQRPARVAEEQAEVAAQVARSEAELPVQSARIEQIRRQLQAEVIEPAIAQRDARIFEAEGDAAQIVEDGRARAEALQEITDIWMSYGESAKRALLMQKLEPVVELLTSTIDHIEVDRMTLIGPGTGDGADTPWSLKAMRTLEELRSGTGIDVEDAAKKLLGVARPDRSAPQTATEPSRRKPTSTAPHSPIEPAQRAPRNDRRAATRGAATRGADRRPERTAARPLPDRTSETSTTPRNTPSNREPAPATAASPSTALAPERLQARLQQAAAEAVAATATPLARAASPVSRTTPASAAPSSPAEESAGQWYAATRDERIGPLAFQALLRRVDSGDIPRSAFVWRSGMANWERMDDSETWRSAEAAARRPAR